MNFKRNRRAKVSLLKRLFILVFFILTGAVSGAQDGAYLIPRRIYVGDPAVLIVPLPPSKGDSDDIVLTSGFPQDMNIDFHRIILERRLSGGRLLIEFSAYTPGVLQMPDIEIDGEIFSNLTVSVNSLFDGSNTPVLSGPASSLAMPGTAILLYGSLAVFVFLVLFTLWFLFKGRVFLRGLYKKYKHVRLIYSMNKIEKRLLKALSKGAEKRRILDEISLKFREFLSVFTGNNCLSMTAAEFETLPIGQIFPQQHPPGPKSESFSPKHPSNLKGEGLSPDFNHLSLGNFFRACDERRFCGEDVSSQDILRLLDDLRRFLNLFKNAGKAKEAA